jgi:hypothetical protein
MFNVPPSSLRLDTRCSLSTRRPGFLPMSLPQCRSPVAIAANEVVQQPPLSIGMTGFTVIKAFQPIDFRIGFVGTAATQKGKRLRPGETRKVERKAQSRIRMRRVRPLGVCGAARMAALKSPSVRSILKM